MCSYSDSQLVPLWSEWTRRILYLCETRQIRAGSLGGGLGGGESLRPRHPRSCSLPLTSLVSSTTRFASRGYGGCKLRYTHVRRVI